MKGKKPGITRPHRCHIGNGGVETQIVCVLYTRSVEGSINNDETLQNITKS